MDELIAWLETRAKWIDMEMRHGADLNHMQARYAECQYILAHARLLDPKYLADVKALEDFVAGSTAAKNRR